MQKKADFSSAIDCYTSVLICYWLLHFCSRFSLVDCWRMGENELEWDAEVQEGRLLICYKLLHFCSHLLLVATHLFSSAIGHNTSVLICYLVVTLLFMFLVGWLLQNGWEWTRMRCRRRPTSHLLLIATLLFSSAIGCYTSVLVSHWLTVGEWVRMN